MRGLLEKMFLGMQSWIAISRLEISQVEIVLVVTGIETGAEPAIQPERQAAPLLGSRRATRADARLMASRLGPRHLYAICKFPDATLRVRTVATDSGPNLGDRSHAQLPGGRPAELHLAG